MKMTFQLIEKDATGRDVIYTKTAKLDALKYMFYLNNVLGRTCSVTIIDTDNGTEYTVRCPGIMTITYIPN